MMYSALFHKLSLLKNTESIINTWLVLLYCSCGTSLIGPQLSYISVIFQNKIFFSKHSSVLLKRHLRLHKEGKLCLWLQIKIWFSIMYIWMEGGKLTTEIMTSDVEICVHPKLSNNQKISKHLYGELFDKNLLFK